MPASPEDLRAEVLAQRLAQGLPSEPTEEQLSFVGAVVANDRKK
jgi:hypothetical protein